MPRTIKLPKNVFPTRAELEWARAAFEEIEPHDLFYRAATELVGLALAGQGQLSTAEALAVLLKTWNFNFYRFKKVEFNEQHFADIEALFGHFQVELRAYRERHIDDFRDSRDCDGIVQLFDAFEQRLGAVGAAKALHLLAPSFFPLWDTGIAAAYALPLGSGAAHGESYCTFMLIASQQIEHVGGEAALGRNPLKALDEYNYCRYTRNLRATGNHTRI
jgi:hypothetical protein